MAEVDVKKLAGWEEEEKLNKKLGERVGFKYGHIKGEGNYYSYPGSDEKYYGYKPFTDDLNAVDGYLIPNIEDLIGFYIYPTTDGWSVTMVIGTGPHPLYWTNYEGHGETLAIAICKAFEQRVDAETKSNPVGGGSIIARNEGGDE